WVLAKMTTLIVCEHLRCANVAVFIDFNRIDERGDMLDDIVANLAFNERIAVEHVQKEEFERAQILLHIKIQLLRHQLGIRGADCAFSIASFQIGSYQDRRSASYCLRNKRLNRLSFGRI